MGKRMSTGSGGDTDPSSVTVGSVAFNPRNPRDGLELDDEFVESVAMYGVMQPITVIRYELFVLRYKDLESEVGQAHWVVVHGNRRLAAAQKAGLETVPVAVSASLAREDRIDESVLIENVHRQDLPPLREALLVSQLVDKHGSQSSAARALAKSEGWVSQRLRLLKLAPQLQQRLATRELTVEAARELATLPEARQLAAWEAGPPYKYKAKRASKSTPREGVDPQDSSTFERVELAPEGETAKRQASAGVQNGGSSLASPSASEQASYEDQAATSLYGVKTDPELVTAMRRHSPGEVAEAVRAALPPERVTEVAFLLRNE